MELLKGKKKFILFLTLTIVLIHWFGGVIVEYLFLGLCAIFISDLILVRLKVIEDRKADRILSRYTNSRET